MPQNSQFSLLILTTKLRARKKEPLTHKDKPVGFNEQTNKYQALLFINGNVQHSPLHTILGWVIKSTSLGPHLLPSVLYFHMKWGLRVVRMCYKRSHLKSLPSLLIWKMRSDGSWINIEKRSEGSSNWKSFWPSFFLISWFSGTFRDF